MASKKEVSDKTRDRQDADRLEAIALKARAASGRGLADVFALGAAFEEAADILKGSFSAWVKAECQVEPRTALGYRKAHRVLADRKDWLVEHGASPSVVVLIAAAGPDGRERALSAIGSGRSLSAGETRRILRDGKSRTPPRKVDDLSRLVQSRARGLMNELEALAGRLAVDGRPDAESPAHVRDASLILAVSLLLSGDGPDGSGADGSTVRRFLAELSTLTDPDGFRRAASGLADFLKQPADAPERGSALPAVPKPAPKHPSASLTTAFKHGLSALEICAGAGGQAAGLAKAGFHHVGLLERNPIACQTLRAAFGPEHVIEADLVGYEPDGLEGVDLLAGGVPCQPFSQAGKRKGAQDRRDLFPEALRLVERLRPRAVMLENVKGLLEKRNDTYRFGIQAKLKRLGYDSEWRVVDASHFGVPQKRLRAILVAFREPEAMARFVWPTAWVPHHTFEPYPIIAALIDQIQSRGWRMPLEMQDRMNRAANTILGGSSEKQGADLGQRNGSIHWVEMGVIRTRIADEPPAADHVGDVALTNRMLATLQGFPLAWPFAGKKVPVFRQIGNAFPPPVAMHLGCAIASALTGELVNPARQYMHEGRKCVFLPRDHRIPVRFERNPPPPPRPGVERVHIPLDLLRAAATPADESDPAIQGYENWFTLPVAPPGEIPLDILRAGATGAHESDPAI